VHNFDLSKEKYCAQTFNEETALFLEPWLLGMQKKTSPSTKYRMAYCIYIYRNMNETALECPIIKYQLQHIGGARP
jgi:hypothetical protein